MPLLENLGADETFETESLLEVVGGQASYRASEQGLASVLHYNREMLNIRAAEVSDVPLLIELIRELAEYEKAPAEAVATPHDLVRDGFSGNPRFRALVAEWDGQPAGFALFFYNYSTWRGRPGIYLEDLFVRPQFRKRGVGKALLGHLANLAIREGCGRFEWQVLDWNTPAIEFYKSLGARPLTAWITMRITGPELEKLGRGAAHENQVP